MTALKASRKSGSPVYGLEIDGEPVAQATGFQLYCQVGEMPRLMISERDGDVDRTVFLPVESFELDGRLAPPASSVIPGRRDPALPPSETAPLYYKVLQNPEAATETYLIVCDEGWRQSIVCADVQRWAVDWLLALIGRCQYAPGTGR